MRVASGQVTGLLVYRHPPVPGRVVGLPGGATANFLSSVTIGDGGPRSRRKAIWQKGMDRHEKGHHRRA